MNANSLYMYVSQWGEKMGAPGLSLFAFDPASGAMEKLAQLDAEKSFGCSFIDPVKNVMYVCNEGNLFPQAGYNTGRVYCYRLDPATGAITELNHRETYCPYPSYLSPDPTGRYLVVSNHSWTTYVTTAEKTADGRITPVNIPNDSLINLFALNEDGSLGAMTDIKKHTPAPGLRYTLEHRLTTPHPHCAVRSPSGRLYAVCDKGDGHLYLYAIDKETRQLKLLSRTLTDAPDSEPRYCVFHPTLPYLYVNHEHTPGDRITVTAFRYEEDGRLERLGALNADPGSRQPPETIRQQQGMCIAPNGKYVYTQAHGYNLLFVLAVDERTGLLCQQQAVPLEGIWPRAVTTSPDGRFVITTSLQGTMAVYAVGADGFLTDTGHRAHAQGGGYISFFHPQA